MAMQPIHFNGPTWVRFRSAGFFANLNFDFLGGLIAPYFIILLCLMHHFTCHECTGGELITKIDTLLLDVLTSGHKSMLLYMPGAKFNFLKLCVKI